MQYFVTAVSLIHHRGEDILFPMATELGGKYTRYLKGSISDIMYGRADHEWGVVIKETQ